MDTVDNISENRDYREKLGDFFFTLICFVSLYPHV